MRGMVVAFHGYISDSGAWVVGPGNSGRSHFGTAISRPTSIGPELVPLSSLMIVTWGASPRRAASFC